MTYLTDETDERQIIRALDRAGLHDLPQLHPQLARQLSQWLRAMLAEPRNLTAIRDPDAAIARHAVEPLLGRRRLIDADLPVPHGPMIDIGSGNGAPGLPFALCEPQREAVLLDARAGATRFLRAAIERIGAARISVLDQRAELAARAEESRARFALALSRAAAPPPIALELAIPFLCVGGIAMLWTGELDADAVDRLNRAAEILGAAPTPLDPPCGITVFTKVRATDRRYPRPWNQIRRQPLPGPIPDQARVSLAVP